MTLADVRETLDAYEAGVQEQMAAHGWRLERAVYRPGQLPEGWNYMSLGYGAGVDPFRVELLTRWMPAKQKPRHSEESERACRSLMRLMWHVWAAREALASGNAGACLAIGMAIEQEARRVDEPAVLAAGVSRAQAARAQRPRPGRLGPAALAVTTALERGYQTTEEVCNFLNNNAEIGAHLECAPRRGGFTIKDFRHDLEDGVAVFLESGRIPRLLTEAKARRRKLLTDTH